MVQSPPSSSDRAAAKGFGGADAPQEQDLYKCVHCGFCLNVCPTYLETGLEPESPRGRIALMKAVNEGRLTMGPGVVPHWDLCIQCRACEAACPSNVPYGRLMEATRAQMSEQVKRPWHVQLARRVGFHWILPHPVLTRLFGRSLRFYRKSGLMQLLHRTGLIRLIPGDAEALDDYLPPLDVPFFKANDQRLTPHGTPRAKVAMLAGCVMPLMDGGTLESTLRVLVRNGVEVVVPKAQTCCGSLNTHAGERESARAMARRNIDVFLDAGVEAVIVPSGGCSAAMKAYGELLGGDPTYREKAERVAAMTYDVHEYLDQLGIDPPRGALNLKVTYQDACHLAHVQRITAAPRRLLEAIPGLDLVEMPESSVCCGAGGIYSVTEKEMSARLGQRKIRNARSTGAAVIASGNPGCVLQMQNAFRDAGEANVRVRYVIDLLDEAYRAEE